MGLKEILDKIQRALPADADQSLRDAVADAIGEAAVVVDSLGARNRENEKRRIENQEQQSKLDAANAKVGELEKANNSDELNAYKAKAEKYDALVSEQSTAKISKWQENLKKLTEIQNTDKRHEKVQSFLSKVRKPADGQDLSAEDAAHNLELFDVADMANVLTNSEPIPNYGKSSGGDPMPLSGADAVLNIIKKGK